MRWTNVRLICFQGVRDQIRDRRTLFAMAVLPLLLYPVVALVFLQVLQVPVDSPTSVLV